MTLTSLVLALDFPVLISIGPVTIHPHLAFELLAYAVGIGTYWALRSRMGDRIATADRWSLFAAVAVGAVLGSRLLNLFDQLSVISEVWGEVGGGGGDVLRLLGGQTVVGGLLGAWLAVEIQKRRLGITAPTGDLLAVPAALSIAVGRIGCFLSGLPDGTYGIATSMPWGVNLGDGVARHPTALYETVFLVLLAFVLMAAFERLAAGLTFVLFVSSYLLFRLVVDSIKPGDPLALGLTAIQWACVGGLAYYGVRFARARQVRGAVASPTVEPDR